VAALAPSAAAITTWFMPTLRSPTAKMRGWEVRGKPVQMFHPQVKVTLEAWIGAISSVLIEAGLDPSLAQQRSEDALIAIQGALMLSQAIDAPGVFQRIIQQLPEKLCRTG
jgi:hypothetical protein